MGRLKLKLPEKDSHLYTQSYGLRIDDINYGGHLSNDRFLCLCHDARVNFLKHREMTEMNCYGRGLVMNEAQIVYKGEGFQADEIFIEMYLGDLSRTGFELFYHIKRRTPSPRELGRVKTGQAFFDFDKRKLSPLENEDQVEEFRQLLTDLRRER